jgi:peptidoglycan/xylan/chitin deacetylase (PgdA/CDA1 family)
MAGPRTLVVLSVDTEPSVAGAITFPDRHRPLIDEPVLGMANGRSEALGFILDTLQRHGLLATFFVETAHVRAFGEAPMRGHVEAIVSAGHDVQLHLHPVWTSWADGRYEPARRSTDDCAKVDPARLAELFAEGKALIERWTGRPVTAARAGRFSSSRAVLAASAAAGLPVTSHVNVAALPPPESDLAQPGGVIAASSVRELPVTCFRDRTPGGGGGWRPLQINAVSTAEMIDALDQLAAQHAPVAMIVMHPFDFLKARDKQFSGLRAHHLVQRRLERLCAYLEANDDRFEVATIAEAAPRLPAAVAAPRLVGSPVAALARAATNVIADRLL